MRGLRGEQGGGGGSGLFDGVSGFSDFSENAPGVGMPPTWTLNPTRPVPNDIELLAADDVDNTSPLGNQVLRVRDAVTSHAWTSYSWNSVLAEHMVNNGEVLALIRTGNSDVNAAGMVAAMNVQANNWVTWGTNGNFFTRGYLFIGQWYSNSDFPRSALGQWQWYRYRRSADGKTHQGRWWLTTDSEPGTWRGDVVRPTDDGISGGLAGWVIPTMKQADTEGYQLAYYAFTNDPVGAPLLVPPLP